MVATLRFRQLFLPARSLEFSRVWAARKSKPILNLVPMRRVFAKSNLVRDGYRPSNSLVRFAQGRLAARITSAIQIAGPGQDKRLPKILSTRSRPACLNAAQIILGRNISDQLRNPVPEWKLLYYATVMPGERACQPSRSAPHGATRDCC